MSDMKWLPPGAGAMQADRKKTLGDVVWSLFFLSFLPSRRRPKHSLSIYEDENAAGVRRNHLHPPRPNKLSRCGRRHYFSWVIFLDFSRLAANFFGPETGWKQSATSLRPRAAAATKGDKKNRQRKTVGGNEFGPFSFARSSLARSSSLTQDIHNI